MLRHLAVVTAVAACGGGAGHSGPDGSIGGGGGGDGGGTSGGNPAVLYMNPANHDLSVCLLGTPSRTEY